MQTYEKVEVRLHAFLALIVEECEWLDSCPAALP